MNTPNDRTPDQAATAFATFRQKMADPVTVVLPGYAFAAMGLFALAIVVMALD